MDLVGPSRHGAALVRDAPARAVHPSRVMINSDIPFLILKNRRQKYTGFFPNLNVQKPIIEGVLAIYIDFSVSFVEIAIND